ncbi:MAG: hypothetical protein D6694_15290 [Gammaproteobacteria bacterium]|nr:MAG: hypothetical protein D6694_15290 [Gammaproteobacteria bacterium]
MVNFEQLADEFSRRANNGQPISRCDVLEIHPDRQEVWFIEDTNLTHPRNPVPLWEDDVFEKNFRENICKMWGSLVVWHWARAISHPAIPVANVDLSKFGLVYLLRFPALDADQQLFLARPIKNLIEKLYRYRNGAFANVQFIEK